MTETVRSAARVLDVLEYLAGMPDGASLTSCVSTLGIPKSSALMLLRTVVARGYATKDRDDRYRLNDAFAKYGFGWGGHRLTRLMAVAEPVMADLCREVGETVFLSTSGTTGVKVLAKIVSEQTVRYDADISAETPYYCTAIGRVLMAFSPPPRAEEMLTASPLITLTPRTITDINKLRQILEQVRTDGYAVVEEELVLGGTGVAAPILDRNQQVLAVLDVGSVTSRFHDKRDLIIQHLRRSAEIIARALDSNPKT